MSQGHFNLAASAYGGCRPDYPRELSTCFKGQLPADTNRPVLDVGCGPGNLTRSLRSVGIQTIGIDPSDRMLQAARERCEIPERWVQGLGERLPFGDQTLAGIVCSQSLHWIDEGEFLVSAKRCLVDEGILAVAWQAPSVEVDPVEQLIASVLQDTIGLKPEETGRRRNMDEVVACIDGPFHPLGSESWTHDVQWSAGQVALYLKSRLPACSNALLERTRLSAQAEFGDDVTISFTAYLSLWQLTGWR